MSGDRYEDLLALAAAANGTEWGDLLYANFTSNNVGSEMFSRIYGDLQTLSEHDFVRFWARHCTGDRREDDTRRIREMALEALAEQRDAEERLRKFVAATAEVPL